MGYGFVVGGELASLIGSFEEVLLRFLPVLGLGVVVGEQAVEILEAVSEERLDRGGHLAVQVAATLQEDALVGGLLHEGVLEDVLKFGIAGLLEHQFASLEGGEVVSCSSASAMAASSR